MIERRLAPLAVRAMRAIGRSPLIPLDLKLWLWARANHNFFHHGAIVIGTDALGNRMECLTSDFVQKHVAVFGVWEPRITDYLLAKQHVSGTFLDIGANVGYYSLLASRIFDNVISFEPAPKNFAKLTANIAANGADNISAFELAISDQRQIAPLYRSVDHDNSGMSSLREENGAAFEANIKCVPLQDVVDDQEWRRVKFIKVDVEGAELQVVKSLLLSANLLPRDVEISIEINGDDGFNREVFARLTAAGFDAFDLASTYLIDDYFKKMTARQLCLIAKPPETLTDCLFRRRDP